MRSQLLLTATSDKTKHTEMIEKQTAAVLELRMELSRLEQTGSEEREAHKVTQKAEAKASSACAEQKEALATAREEWHRQSAATSAQVQELQGALEATSAALGEARERLKETEEVESRLRLESVDTKVRLDELQVNLKPN